ncbi:type II toxin-antitoxin system death-on-curing family toxin [Shewanella colwelliana]|uniref:type II toxin-antitoxin system death-on-curing family toxin n=1 Tax=Shewanella colwelliana TaxID=23 RepID=UPI003735E810
MNIIQFPVERVVEINQTILMTEPGFRGEYDIGRLSGALSRIDNAIAYENLDDIFLIAAKYAASVAMAHAFSDANKRTGLALCLEYLSLNDYEISIECDELSIAMVDLVVGTLCETEFADVLYSMWYSV